MKQRKVKSNKLKLIGLENVSVLGKEILAGVEDHINSVYDSEHSSVILTLTKWPQEVLSKVRENGFKITRGKLSKKLKGNKVYVYAIYGWA